MPCVEPYENLWLLKNVLHLHLQSCSSSVVCPQCNAIYLKSPPPFKAALVAGKILWYELDILGCVVKQLFCTKWKHSLIEFPLTITFHWHQTIVEEVLFHFYVLFCFFLLFCFFFLTWYITESSVKHSHL